MELQKIRNGETVTKTSKELSEKESYKSAMLCWESLDDLEPTSKKRKTHSQDEATNDKADEMYDKTHTKCTTNTGTHLNIPVDDLQLGADDNALMLATQETSVKNLVYITNIPEGKLDRTKNVQDSSKNSGEQDDKKCSPLEKSDQVTSNDKLNAYGESERDAKTEKGEEHKTNAWQTRKIIHVEFELDNDVAELIRGSVMIGNGESISCTHKGKLDVICKHKDGSTAKQTWEVKIVPQLNHDLFSFTKAMKEGWQMNGQWKEGGLMIELFKTTKTSMKFDRMIPSGSSWLMGIKTQRLVGQAHAVIEPGKRISNLEIPPNNWTYWRASSETNS